MLAIEPYRPARSEELLAFLARCLPESGRTFDPAGRHAHLRDVESSFDAFWCLVEDGERIAGCVGVRTLGEGICELETLFVLERLHGQGWGRRLAEQAIAFARAEGFRTMRLDTISTSRNAIGLYRRLGFESIERYDDNPAADVFMELALARP